MNPSEGKYSIFSGEEDQEIFRQIVREYREITGKSIDVGSNEFAALADEIVSEYANELLITLKRKAPEMIQYEELRRSSFAADNNTIWKEFFDLLEMQLKLSCETISNFVKDVGPLIKDEGLLFKALSALHGNACLVSQEVLSLMRSGYASGALARWRKIYEIEITAAYLWKMGRGHNNLVQRYLDFSIFEKFRAVELYSKDSEIFRQHSVILGYEPYPEEDVRRVKESRDKLADKYEPYFCSNYGWAATTENKNISFWHLAEIAGIKYLYPYYQLANRSVHGGSSGLFWNISLPIHAEDTILIGPTYYGMEGPGQLLAISLNHINRTLLSLHPSISAKEIILVSDRITDDVIKCMKEIQFDLRIESKIQSQKEDDSMTQY